MRYTLLVFALGFLQGCSFPVPSYQVSLSNQKILENASNQVAVIFDESGVNDTGSISCRGTGLVTLSEGETFSKYIVKSLKEELKQSGKLSQQSNKKIIAKYKRIDFSSQLGATNWYIDAIYNISGKEISISTVYHARSSYFGGKACNNIALYFKKAVEVHLSELYSNPTFQDELGFLTSKENALSDIESRLLELKQLREADLISEEEFNRKRAHMLDSL
jgi:hypothetical protein